MSKSICFNTLLLFLFFFLLHDEPFQSYHFKVLLGRLFLSFIISGTALRLLGLSTEARTLSLCLKFALWTFIWGIFSLCLRLSFSFLLPFSFFLHLFKKVIFFFDRHQNQLCVLVFLFLKWLGNLALLFVKFRGMLSVKAFTGFPMSFEWEVLLRYAI